VADDIVTADETPVTVCMRHYRFVPCRRCSEPTLGFWSTEPADIDLVRRVQQRRTPPAPDLGLRERLTAVVHNTLATGGSDTDVADAILAMPEMDAIRLQLGYMANSLAVGCNDDVNHGESMTDTLSEHLDPALITWVLGWHENTADEIERLRAMVDWFVDHRLWDFDDHPEYGPGLAYDGIITGEPLPDDIVQAFRNAVRVDREAGRG
jgi:hypothetical protein